MYNKKTLAVIGMTALMLVTMAGCGSKNNTAAEVNTTTSTTAAPVKVENETKKSVTEATTEATTEAVTEAQTEAQAASEEATEAVKEAPAEVVETPAEAPAEPVIEAPEPVVVEGSAPPSGQPDEPVEKPAPITNAGSLTVYNTKVDETGKTKYCYNGDSIDISKVDIPEGVTYIYTSNAAGPLYEFYYGDIYVDGTRKYWAYTEEEVYGQINRSLASQMQWLRKEGKIK